MEVDRPSWMQRSGEGRNQAHHKNVGNCRQIVECVCMWCAPLARLFRGTGGDACQRKRGTAGRHKKTRFALGRERKVFCPQHPIHQSIHCTYIYICPSDASRERTHKVRLGCSQSALSCAILVMHRPLPLNARCPQQKLTWLFVSLSLWLFPLVSAFADNTRPICRLSQRRTAPALSQMASIFESATNND
jgi:hypothetical protein